MFKVADAYVAVSGDDTNLAADLRAKVVAAVAEATDGVEAKVALGLTDAAPEDLLADLDAAILLAGEDKEVRVGMGLSAASVEELDADVKAGIDLVEADTKIKVSVDPKAAQNAGQGAGSLIMAAIGAGMAIGPAALETAMAGALVVVTADALKSNAVIAADYKQLGEDGASAIKSATAPLAGDLNQALVSMDGSLKTLQPDLDALFAAAGPDIGQFETGVGNLATSALPGLSAAVASSQADVAGFASGLTPLGTGVGDFFTGLATDSTTTSLGLQSVMGTLGSVVGTTGTIIGSASSAISADLLGLDPVLNGFSGAVRAIADPATVGGLAGAFGAMKLDPSISTGLGNLSTKLLTVSQNTEGASGWTDRFSGAALKSAGALSTAAGVMSGPWGIAIGAGIGLASGLVGSLINASHASDALTLSQDGLQKAIASDGAGVGEATAAYVAQSAAQDGLAASAAKAGVSLATWTSAVTGNKQAQSDVTAAVDKLNASQLKQITTQDATAKDLRGGTTVSLDTARQATDQLTETNQQLISSMFAQSGQIASTISDQQKMSAALITLSSNTAIFNATLDAAQTAAQLQYQAAAQSSVALLGLGDTQSTLNMKLVNGEAAYATATGAAAAYNAVLASLDGSAMSMDQAQNTMAQDLLNAATSFKANKYSMDLSTAGGIANRQAIVNAATAIQAMGVQTFQATGNMNTANGVIQQQVNAFVKATGATGTAKTAIEQYLEQIAKIPANVSTTVTANTSSAANALTELKEQLLNLQGISNINITNQGGLKAITHNAQGGPVHAGETSWVGEEGPEIVTFAADGYVTPNNQLGRLIGGGANPAQPAQHASAQPAPVTFKFYGSQYPTGEQMAQLRREFVSVGAF